MSKDEEVGCKLNSNCKHKERKPKKPHYIPRPWGKPYNYKCFQCPFTCMEKSHLYNHMKYSLCKNSLSLLIESDWPYKKNNFLVPEVNLNHEAHTEGNRDKQEPCDSSASSTKLRHIAEKSSSEVQRLMEDEDERLEDDEDEVGSQAQKEKGKDSPPLQVTVGKNDANVNDATSLKNKREALSKEGEPEFIITDVFSLEGQCEKDREEQRFSKVPRKTSNNAGNSRLDQWKLLTNTFKKSVIDTQVGCSGANIIPCYPPPTYTDYQEHQGLSLLGLNYPKSSNLFSYLNPTMTTGTAQVPFLASTAQLMHPAHFSHFQALHNTERSSFIPQFYYPLLFDHTFSTTDTKVTGKPLNQGQPGNMAFLTTAKAKAPVEPQKTCLLKTQEATSLPSWGPGDKLQNPTVSHNKAMQEAEPKWVPNTVREIIQQQKEILGVYGLQASRINESSTHKGTTEESLWEKASPTICVKRKTWLDRDKPEVITDQTASSVERDRTFHSSSCSPITSPDHWREKSPLHEGASKRRRGSEPAAENSEPMTVNASLLIGDLSRTLEEYGRVERKLANLTSDDSGRQKTLSEQLGKIRLELLNIHHALEKASCPHEGPLDLSVKKPDDMIKEDPEKGQPRVDAIIPSSPECSPKVVKVELLPPELVTCYARPTKCEADSSVLVCPDGRIGSIGVAPAQVPAQEDGAGVGFSRGRIQMENV